MSSLRNSMAIAIAYPCMDSRDNVRRISMSSVPCTSSPLLRCFGIDRLYLDGLYLGMDLRLQSILASSRDSSTEAVSRSRAPEEVGLWEVPGTYQADHS